MPENAVDPVVVLTYGHSGVGKCLAGTAKVVLADGSQMTVAEIVQQNCSVEVLALGSDYKLCAARVGRVWDNGKKPVVRVKTKFGRAVDVTLNHPLLGADGWQPVTAFEVGDLVAVPRSLRVGGKGLGGSVSPFTDAHVKILAYHLANGQFRDSALLFSSGNHLVVNELREALAEAFPDVELRNVTLHGEPTIDYRIAKASMEGGRKKTSSAMAFFRDLDLEDEVPTTKFIPAALFRAPASQQALFLSRYLGCDGSVEATGRVSFCSASKQMFLQVVHLLLRFGIWGSSREKVVNGTSYWEWSTNDWECKSRLSSLADAGIFTKPIPLGEPPSRVNHHDRLPVKRGDFYKQLGQTAYASTESFVSRGHAQKMLQETQVLPELESLAWSDVLWDSIVEIEPLGLVHTYDLTIPDHHNFVADDFFVHNTTDMGYSFPNALFLAAPGALNSVKTVCGYEPNRHFVSTIQEATQIIEVVGDSDKYNTVVIDDFSFMAEQTFAWLEAHKFTGYKLWGKLRDVTIDFRDKSRYCGVNVILNGWEQAPKKKDNGQYVKGGPMLSGRLPEQIPALCDLVLRAVPEPRREPWPGAYHCRLDPDWVMKDRFNIAYRVDPCPMNLAEILRASGVHIDRLHEGQEEEVEALTAGDDPIFKGIPAEDRNQANEVYKALVSSGQSVTRARWTVRDALDRALIKRALEEANSSFFSSAPKTNTLG